MARPRLGESERRTRTIGVRVTEAEAAELQAARLSMGAYLRRRGLGQRGRIVAARRLGGGGAAGAEPDRGEFKPLALLLLAWVTTEAVLTQSRVLVLGDSLSDFMRALGVYSNSGTTGCDP